MKRFYGPSSSSVHFYGPTPGSGVLLHGHGIARSQNDAFRVHLKNSFFCSLDLFASFSIRPYNMNTYEDRLTARRWWAKRMTFFFLINCHNDQIIVYTPVVHTSSFQNRRKGMTLAVTIHIFTDKIH